QQNIGEGLPDARRKQACHCRGDQAEPLQNPVVSGWTQEKCKRLHKESTRADKHNQLDTGGNETAPIEVVTPRAEGTCHLASLRRLRALVKGASRLAVSQFSKLRHYLSANQ